MSFAGPAAGHSAPGALPAAEDRCFLWIDLRRATRDRSPFHDIAGRAHGRFVVGTQNLSRAIGETRPHFLVFEFDAPDRCGLDAMFRAKKWFPELPVMMLTEAHSETLAVWALRIRVWDYLVKPLPIAEIANRIETLRMVARMASRERRREPMAPAADVPALPVAGSAPALRTAPAIAYVESCYDRHIAVGTVAALCRLSNSGFSRTFHREHGITFSDYLLRYRVEQARLQLTARRSSLLEIALATGFCDQSHLSKAFKRVVGVCPARYVGPE